VRIPAVVGLLALFSGTAFCQAGGVSPAATSSASPQPSVFVLADVHASPFSNTPFFTGPLQSGGRYVLRNATMLDLITTAYGVDAEKVLGGPSWLEVDRFDVIAKVPAGTTVDTAKPMLQALLADRFKLAIKTDSQPLQAFALTIGKAGKPKLKESTDSTGSTGCQFATDPANPTPGVIAMLVATCHAMTMDALADTLHQFAAGYLTSSVVNMTGLKGTWDFNFRWHGRGALARAGADGVSIFDAVDKQLGLKLELQKISLPAITVLSVDEKPTPNSPEVKAALPPAPPAEFEVAVIKPSAQDEQPNGAINGGQINIQAITLKDLITIGWQINPNDSEQLVGAPKWLGSDKFDIVAKISSDKPVEQFPFDDLLPMLRALLIDRFQMKVHTEDRPVDAYKLVADKPKLAKADPANRTKCKEGPGPDGKDPRITNPVLNRLLTCQNMTMAQFGDQLRTLAGGYIHSPVLDATGLEGAYDFTISFSGIGLVRNGGTPGAGRGVSAPEPSPSSGAAPTASDPNGALSLFDAINKQLGLKLVKEKRPMPVLVIDHIEEKPTDN